MKHVKKILALSMLAAVILGAPGISSAEPLQKAEVAKGAHGKIKIVIPRKDKVTLFRIDGALAEMTKLRVGQQVMLVPHRQYSQGIEAFLSLFGATRVNPQIKFPIYYEVDSDLPDISDSDLPDSIDAYVLDDKANGLDQWRNYNIKEGSASGVQSFVSHWGTGNYAILTYTLPDNQQFAGGGDVLARMPDGDVDVLRPGQVYLSGTVLAARY